MSLRSRVPAPVIGAVMMVALCIGGHSMVRVYGTPSQSDLTQNAVAPPIELVAPAANAVYLAPGPITLTARVSDGGAGPDAVTSVTFYANGVQVDIVRKPPYSLPWKNVAPGAYEVTAVGRTRGGATVSSEKVSVSVKHQQDLPLVKPSSLHYQGAFRLPAGTVAGTSFGWSGTALAYNPAHHSLFIVGHDWHQKVAEIAIPEIRNVPTVAGHATATFLQPFADPAGGKLPQVNPGDPNGIKIGGILPFGDRLIFSAYAYYDGAGSQVRSHFVSGARLSDRHDVKGPFRMGSLKAGYVSGYMAMVPAGWQAALGGAALTGQCCINIINRTSYGPAVSVFDPADVGKKFPTPATALLYYPAEHPLTNWNVKNPLFHGATQVRGLVFPAGTRSVLFIGRHGLGPFCYGEAKACKDPASADKGTHAYPYAYYVWAYDASDLAAVKRGSKRPWDVRPYAYWQLEPPFKPFKKEMQGAAYDPATGRIFMTQGFADEDRPMVLVYTLDLP